MWILKCLYTFSALSHFLLLENKTFSTFTSCCRRSRTFYSCHTYQTWSLLSLFRSNEILFEFFFRFGLFVPFFAPCLHSIFFARSPSKVIPFFSLSRSFHFSPCPNFPPLNAQCKWSRIYGKRRLEHNKIIKTKTRETFWDRKKSEKEKIIIKMNATISLFNGINRMSLCVCICCVWKDHMTSASHKVLLNKIARPKFVSFESTTHICASCDGTKTIGIRRNDKWIGETKRMKRRIESHNFTGMTTISGGKCAGACHDENNAKYK